MNIRTTALSPRIARPAKLLALCLALLCAGTLTGCGGFFQAITTTTTNTGTGYDIVYVGRNSTNEFAGYQVLSTGLTAVTGSPFSISSPPLSMAITPTNSYLYVGTATAIYGYSIAAGGVLTALNSGSSMAVQPSNLAPVSTMDISPDGDWLVVMNDIGGTISVLTYAINVTTGALTPTTAAITQFPLPTTNSTQTSNATSSVALGVKFSPDEKSQTNSVLVASLGTGGQKTFLFNSTSGLVSEADLLQQTTATNVSNNAAIWTADSTTLYFARSIGTSGVVSYPVSTTAGTFTNTASNAPSTGNNPTAITFNSSQSYLYAVNSADNTVTGYKVATSSGSTTLTTLSGSPYLTSSIGPDAIAFDNSDNYILVMSQAGPPDLVQFTIDGVTNTSTTTPGRLYVTSSVTTPLTNGVAIGTLGSGITMVTTH